MDFDPSEIYEEAEAHSLDWDYTLNNDTLSDFMYERHSDLTEEQRTAVLNLLGE